MKFLKRSNNETGECKMRNLIKKVLPALWTIYTAFTSFISPIWLTVIFLNLSGKIYQLDYMYDEGAARIIGMMMLFMWLIFVLTPNVLYLLTPSDTCLSASGYVSCSFPLQIPLISYYYTNKMYHVNTV